MNMMMMREAAWLPTKKHLLLSRLRLCQDYERAEGNCALGIGAILDKNMDTMDDVFYS